MANLNGNGGHLDYLQDNRTNLEGSSAADAFKRFHKTLDKTFYGVDIDFVLVQRNPFDIVGILDFKERNSDLSAKNGLHFSSAVAYQNFMIAGFKVYLVYFDWNKYKSPEFSRITVCRIDYVDPLPNPPQVDVTKLLINGTVNDYSEWEQKIREKHQPASSKEKAQKRINKAIISMSKYISSNKL